MSQKHLKTMLEAQLRAQYKVLSEVEEMWGVKPSKHRAYVFITKRMRQILKELQTLKQDD